MLSCSVVTRSATSPTVNVPPALSARQPLCPALVTQTLPAFTAKRTAVAKCR